MENEQGGAGGDTRPARWASLFARNGLFRLHHLRAEGGPASQRAHGALQHEARPADHQSPQGGNRDSHSRPADAVDPGQRTSHPRGAGTVWQVQGIPLLRGALKLLGLGDHGDGRQQLAGPDPACALGQGEQVQEGRRHLQEQAAGLLRTRSPPVNAPPPAELPEALEKTVKALQDQLAASSQEPTGRQ